MSENNSFGVYVHFPWCLSACPYCDFAFEVARRGRGIPHAAYADAVLAELAELTPKVAGRRLRSVYFGGGTPGLWAPAELARALGAIVGAFPADAPLEVTVEVNPADETLQHGRLDELRAAGVTRLSIGAQSLDARLLRKLGRLHRAPDTAATVAAARSAGIPRLSIDLMLGVPGQSAGDAEADVDSVLALAPDHLSVYGLSVEAGTVFGRRAARGTLGAAKDDDLADRLLATRKRLQAAGFEHYEISSYARPGARSVHNELYWTGGEWLGLGASAWSSRHQPGGGVERWRNDPTPAGYLARPRDAVVTRETLTPAEARREAVWLGLRRLLDGVPHAAADATISQPLLDQGLLEHGGLGLRLTERGFLLADEVGRRFL